MTSSLELPLEARIPEDLYASWSPSPSPDGQRIAYISDRGGTPQVWLDGVPAVPVPLDGLRVTAVTWSPAADWLACTVASPGRSGSQVWVVRPDGSGLRLVAGAGSATALTAGGRSRGWTADGALVVTETTELGRVLRVDPATGRRTSLHQADLTVAVDVSADGRRLLVRRGPRGARDLYVIDVSSEGPLSDFPRDPVVPRRTGGTTDLGCLSPDGATVYARTDADREHAELVVVTVDSGTVTLVVPHPGGELEDVSLDPDGRRAVLTWNVDGGLSAVTLLDTATGRSRPVALPRPVVSGAALTGSTSTGRGRLIVTAEGPADPRGVWAGDGGGPLRAVSSPGRGALLASYGASSDSIEPKRAVPPQLLRFASADGTPLSGWLYRPPDAGPAPTVVWLHGGPEAQERPVYNSLFQSLVAEGLAVFAPNVRGSSGLGRAFRSADDGAGRYGAFADVAACAELLVRTGVAQPGRLALTGRSYGGYLTLSGLVRYPELFRVGVSVCGMSDLHTFYAGTEPWISATAVSKYGHPDRDRDLLRDLSPLRMMDRLRAPLLLVHGAEDTNVPVRESRQVAEELARHGKPHRLLVFEGEGHELLDTANRVALVHAVLEWMREHL